MAYSIYKKDGTLKKKPGPKPDPAKAKKPSTFVRDVPRPQVWITGPDEFKHSMYHPWQMSKAQAKFREEDWELTFEQYYDLWKDYWHQRGRQADDYCMTRDDVSGAWSVDNIRIITRRKHLEEQGLIRDKPLRYTGKKSQNTDIVYKKMKVSKNG